MTNGVVLVIRHSVFRHYLWRIASCSAGAFKQRDRTDAGVASDPALARGLSKAGPFAQQRGQVGIDRWSGAYPR